MRSVKVLAAFGASQITRITKTAAVSSNAIFRLPHRALPRESSANTESQPIHRTQQLPGSALSLFECVRTRPTLARWTLIECFKYPQFQVSLSVPISLNNSHSYRQVRV